MLTKHRASRFVLCLATILFIATPTSGDPVPSATPPEPVGRSVPHVPTLGQGDLVFELVTSKLNKSQTQLVNGIKVELRTRDWPTVVITPLRTGTVDAHGVPIFGKCTGTLVGPGVVLLAAHCLDQRSNDALHDQLRTVYLKVDGILIEMTCAIDPDYLNPPAQSEPTPRRSEDFGLCYANAKVKLPSLSAIRFEQVDVAPVSQNTPVLMMGYGCTDLDSQDQDQILRVGDAKISQSAGGIGGDRAYALIISHGPPAPALCPGDSGGPLFTGASVGAQTLPRRVRGVNSSIQAVGSNLLSRIAMLSEPHFSSWAVRWIGQFPGAYICGLPGTPQTNACRL